MNKYLLVINNEKDAFDMVEVILKFMNVKFEQRSMTQYYIWTDEKTVKELQNFSWMAVIKTEE